MKANLLVHQSQLMSLHVWWLVKPSAYLVNGSLSSQNSDSARVFQIALNLILLLVMIASVEKVHAQLIQILYVGRMVIFKSRLWLVHAARLDHRYQRNHNNCSQPLLMALRLHFAHVKSLWYIVRVLYFPYILHNRAPIA